LNIAKASDKCKEATPVIQIAWQMIGGSLPLMLRTAPVRFSQSVFRAKWMPVRVKKTGQNKNQELRF
jgi:hypothetical protein